MANPSGLKVEQPNYSAMQATEREKEEAMNAKKPKARWELITPTIAQELLAKNTNNRNVVRATVDFYKRQLQHGEWQDNGETVKITKRGMLADGQHRLLAISESGVGVELLVVRGVDEDAIKTIDTGRVRTPADHLRVYGFKGNVAILAAAAKVAMGFENEEGKFLFNHGRLSPSEIISWVEKHKHILYSLERTPDSIKHLMPMSFAVGMHYIFWLKDEFKAEQFFQQLASGENLSEGHPVLALRTRLIAQIDNKRSWNAARKQIVSYMVTAFKALCEGRQIKELKYYPDSDIVCEWLT